MDPKKLDQWGTIWVSLVILVVFGVAYVVCLKINLADQLAAFGETARNLAMIAAGYWLGSSSGSKKKDDAISNGNANGGHTP